MRYDLASMIISCQPSFIALLRVDADVFLDRPLLLRSSPPPRRSPSVSSCRLQNQATSSTLPVGLISPKLSIKRSI